MNTAVESSQTLLDVSPPTFILVAINLLLLYWVLNKLLFSKLSIFMEKRAKRIEEALESAQKAREYGENVRLEYAKKAEQARADIEKSIEEAKAQAVKESEIIIKNAKIEANRIIEAAKKEIENEHNKMIKEIQSEVAGIAIAAASKLIEANLDNETNKKLVEKFINEAGVA